MLPAGPVLVFGRDQAVTFFGSTVALDRRL